MVALSEVCDAIINGDASSTVAKVKAALEENISAKDILDRGLLPGIQRIGNLFVNGEIYFPELLLAGKAVREALEELRPELTREKEGSTGKFLIGTVEGDMHNIGKNIVSMFLEANGWEVTDLGIDLPAERFCEAVAKGDYDILGLSALLTLTMPNAEKTIKALTNSGLRCKVKVMVGGVSMTQPYADRIGADAYGKDAVDAVRKAQRLMSMSRGGKNEENDPS